MDTLLDLPLDDDLRGPRLLLLPEPSLGWSAAQGDLWPFSCPVGGTTHFTVHLQKESDELPIKGGTAGISRADRRGLRDSVTLLPVQLQCIVGARLPLTGTVAGFRTLKLVQALDCGPVRVAHRPAGAWTC